MKQVPVAVCGLMKVKTMISYTNLNIVRGRIQRHTTVDKYGSDTAVGTTYAPVTSNKFYRMPQISGAEKLRVKAGDVTNNNGQAGIWAITVYGIASTGLAASEVLLTNGTSAGVLGEIDFIRVYRVKVAACGTYAAVSIPSHTVEVIIETSGGVEWAKIPAVNSKGEGTSQIAAYSTAFGEEIYLSHLELHVDANKPVDFILYRRKDFMRTATPYLAVEVIDEFPQVTSNLVIKNPYPKKGFPEYTDIWFEAKATQVATAVAKFTLISTDLS